jgi:hypothetical protein
MPRLALALLLAALALPAPAAAAQEPGQRGEVVSLRFAWPAPARARITYRRTRLRTGQRPGTFTARYEALVEPTAQGLAVRTRATTWRGELPFSAALARDAIRASEQVVQQVGDEGEFRGLDGVEALRPVLARVLDDAKVPQEQAERALALALAATRAEAEELWNLAVGFWTGADLKLGETYAMQSEAELPLLPGVRAAHAVEFSVRRRVPCTAGERGARCVEAVLRATPDRAAVERAAPQLLARLAAAGTAQEGAAKDLAAESELVLVTDPENLLPRRVVWTKALRLGARDEGPPDAEQVDRSEYDYRWLPVQPRPARPKRSPPAAPAPKSRPLPAARTARDGAAR